MNNRECCFIGCEDGNRNAVYLVFETKHRSVPTCKSHFDAYYAPYPETYEYVELIPAESDEDTRSSEDMVDTQIKTDDITLRFSHAAVNVHQVEKLSYHAWPLGVDVIQRFNDKHIVSTSELHLSY